MSGMSVPDGAGSGRTPDRAGNARMRRLATWWLRSIRRHFCFACDRTTFHDHRHSLGALQEQLSEEWRA